MDQLSYYITIHEMAKVDASHALTISSRRETNRPT
jgi:hypothetical protein